jgi:hypothetical protein
MQARHFAKAKQRTAEELRINGEQCEKTVLGIIALDFTHFTLKSMN